MNKLFLIIACLCFIIISISIAYYFVLFLPNQERLNSIELKKIQEQTKNIKENSGNSSKSREIQDQLDNIQDAIKQQNEDAAYEAERKGWCEQGGGIYYGNGSCITSNKKQ
jgi:hypothetical protein